MDILYINGSDSKCDNFELRCSLRSIEQYGKNVGKVYVVGNCPEWLSDNVIKLPCEDYNKDTITPYPKAQNIAKKLLYAVDNSDIGDVFLVSMDDHFYVSSVDFDAYPYYTKQWGNATDEIPDFDVNSKFLYNMFLSDCKARLKELNLPTKYFTLHKNMKVYRSAIEGCRDIIAENIEHDYAFEVFLLLGNYSLANLGVVPVMTKDNRIKSAQEWYRTDKSYANEFSTPDFKEFSGLHILMSGLYDKKSKYENNG